MAVGHLAQVPHGQGYGRGQGHCRHDLAGPGHAQGSSVVPDTDSGDTARRRQPRPSNRGRGPHCLWRGLRQRRSWGAAGPRRRLVELFCHVAVRRGDPCDGEPGSRRGPRDSGGGQRHAASARQQHAARLSAARDHRDQPEHGAEPGQPLGFRLWAQLRRSSGQRRGGVDCADAVHGDHLGQRFGAGVLQPARGAAQPGRDGGCWQSERHAAHGIQLHLAVVCFDRRVRAQRAGRPLLVGPRGRHRRRLPRVVVQPERRAVGRYRQARRVLGQPSHVARRIHGH
mmetsp:Transcript_37270/g.87679  ORF Transcript_37270/g.87679 Transcript_37270/m.87679 type:complete len:284 (+) Transcript_37270:663-1514(+)